MLEQPVNTKGCSSIKFLLREFYLEYEKVLFSFLGLESSISWNIRKFFNLGAEKFHFMKYDKVFCGGSIFIFQAGL